MTDLQQTRVPCATCGRPHGDGYTPRHPYRLAGSPVILEASTPEQDDTPTVTVHPWPHDPVLRQALIDKGMLTPDDLRDAEAKIAAITNVFRDMSGKPFIHALGRDDDDTTTG